MIFFYILVKFSLFKIKNIKKYRNGWKPSTAQQPFVKFLENLFIFCAHPRRTMRRPGASSPWWTSFLAIIFLRWINSEFAPKKKMNNSRRIKFLKTEKLKVWKRKSEEMDKYANTLYCSSLEIKSSIVRWGMKQRTLPSKNQKTVCMCTCI